MHKLLFVALSAATVFGAALLPDRADAISLAGAADVRSAQDQLGIIEKVERVCRQFCDDGFCRTRCFHRDDDDDRDRDRRVFRDRDRDRDFDRDRFRDRDRDRDRRDCSRVGPVVVCN
jgi:hypothetical protein